MNEPSLTFTKRKRFPIKPCLRYALLAALGCVSAAHGQDQWAEYDELCQLHKELVAQRTIRSPYCGVVAPDDNPDFTFPDWTDLEPIENLETVKRIYYWWNIFSGSTTHELYQTQMNDRSVILPELMELLWPKAEGQILEAIGRDEISLQYATFDIDADGVDENVYRMTPLIRLGIDPPWERDSHTVEISSACADFDLPTGNTRYRYYIPEPELSVAQMAGTLPGASRQNGFFFWRAKVVWDSNLTLSVPDMQNRYGTHQLCNALTYRN